MNFDRYFNCYLKKVRNVRVATFHDKFEVMLQLISGCLRLNTPPTGGF